MIKIINLNDIKNSINEYFPNLENKDNIITLLSSNLEEDHELAIEIIKLSTNFINGDLIHLVPKIIWNDNYWCLDPTRIINITPTTL